MANTESPSPIRGLDVGTSRIVLARPRSDRVKFEERLNAFVALPYSKMTQGMLEREGIAHIVEGDKIFAYGNRVDEFANIFSGDTRRPMQTGLLNPDEPKGLQMLQLCIEDLCGEASKGDKICFSIPSAAVGHEADLIYHERAVGQILENMGYEVESLNEGLAVVYSELEASGFTGIGVSFGGGMCNVCVSYLGLPVLTFCTVHAGDYIDHSAASVTGETPTTVRLYKESEFSLKRITNSSMDQALAVYYGDVIRSVVDGLEEALSETKRLPKLDKPIPIAVAGGTAQVDGFQLVFGDAVKDASLPVEIGDVRLAKNGFNTTAKGVLMAAMLNM